MNVLRKLENRIENTVRAEQRSWIKKYEDYLSAKIKLDVIKKSSEKNLICYSDNGEITYKSYSKEEKEKILIELEELKLNIIKELNEVTINTYIGCSIIIYNNNEVLISKRSRLKKKFPLMWELIGGALENNESPEECICREVKEEINCNIKDLKLFKVYIVNDDNRYVLIVFDGKLDGEIRINSEIDELKWINKNELNNFDFCGNELEKLVDYFNINGVK